MRWFQLAPARLVHQRTNLRLRICSHGLRRADADGACSRACGAERLRRDHGDQRFARDILRRLPLRIGGGIVLQRVTDPRGSRHRLGGDRSGRAAQPRRLVVGQFRHADLERPEQRRRGDELHHRGGLGTGSRQSCERLNGKRADNLPGVGRGCGDVLSAHRRGQLRRRKRGLKRGHPRRRRVTRRGARSAKRPDHYGEILAAPSAWRGMRRAVHRPAT
jgi:hypothetical protein